MIVATQSPKLLVPFAPEDVVVVERDEEADGFGHSVFQRLRKEGLGSWLAEYDLGQLYEKNVTGGGPVRSVTLRVLCEGRTEMNFVAQVLHPHLRSRQVFAKPELLGGTPAHGALRSSIKHEIGRSRAHVYG